MRIFGTKGFLEILNSGERTLLAQNGKPVEYLDCSKNKGNDFLKMFIEEIITGKKVIPFTLEEELSPLRALLKATRFQT